MGHLVHIKELLIKHITSFFANCRQIVHLRVFLMGYYCGFMHPIRTNILIKNSSPELVVPEIIGKVYHENA